MEAGSGKDSGAGTQLFISNFVITALEEMRHMLAAASSKFPSERYFDERVVLSAEEDAIYRRSAVKRGTSRASDDGGGRGGPDDGARDEEHHERHADAHGHRNRDAPPPPPYCCSYPCPYCTLPLLTTAKPLSGANASRTPMATKSPSSAASPPSSARHARRAPCPRRPPAHLRALRAHGLLGVPARSPPRRPRGGTCCGWCV